MAVSEGQQTVEAIDAVSGISMRRLADLAFAGFAYAHRVERVPVDFTVEDVAGWLIDEPEAMKTVASEIVLATVTKQEKDAIQPKKKAVPKSSR